MATVTGNILEADPLAVAGTFDAKDVRLALLGNVLPGLYAAGDFAASQRALGANMSVDVAQGRAFIDPQISTHQGVYFTRRTNSAAYNTLADAGITWPAADPTNPRIDLLCLQIVDNVEDASGATGSRLALVTGTASASATHQLEANVWPTIPTGYVPITAVRVPAAATTITTANITNLNPVGGGRPSTLYTSTAETTTSSTYARLATPDALMVYVPGNSGRLRLMWSAHAKVSVASGTQGVTLYIDGAQVKWLQSIGAAGATISYENLLGTSYGRAFTSPTFNGNSQTLHGFFMQASSTTDVNDVTTGAAGNVWTSGTVGHQAGPLEITLLAPGWHLLEMRFKTSANTLSVRERRMWAEVIG